MNRNKFRAWDKENEKYFEPTYEADNGKLEYLTIGMNGDLTMIKINGQYHESTFEHRFIVEQYTGLLDKNGVEIYEGDILLERDATIWEKYTKPDGSEWSRMSKIKKDEYYTVYFDSEKAQFVASNHWLWSTYKLTEVIGNIHENKELLEETK